MSDHPSSELSGVFGQPFPEQVAFFRQKLGTLRDTDRWDELAPYEHDTQFMVAGAKGDLLADLAADMQKYIDGGRGIEEFRKDFRANVAKHGWTGWTGEGSVKGEAWRVRTIARTNAYTSYSAGRFAQLKAGNFAFWVYRHGGSRDPRPEHLSWNGVALPPDHLFWTTHYPPSDWGCSCYVVGADTAAGVKRLRGDPDKKLPANWQSKNPKTGEPVGIGKGWGYAPGASVANQINMLLGKVEKWPAPIGAAAGAGLPDTARAQLADDFSARVDELLLRRQARGEVMTVGTLQPAWVEKARAEGVAPVSAEIVVQDKDILHTFRPNKVGPLDLNWYRRLPEHIGSPSAVLLDKSKPDKPAYLLVYASTNGTQNKLVVSIDYTLRRVDGPRNVLTSGRSVRRDDVLSQIDSGDVILLEGEV